MGSPAAHDEIEGGAQKIQFDHGRAAQFADGFHYSACGFNLLPGRIKSREFCEMDANRAAFAAHPFLETFSDFQFGRVEIVFLDQRFHHFFRVVLFGDFGWRRNGACPLGQGGRGHHAGAVSREKRSRAVGVEMAKDDPVVIEDIHRLFPSSQERGFSDDL